MRISDWSSVVCSSDLLAARELADLLLPVAAPEVEGDDIGARLSLVLAELNDVEPAGVFFPHRLVSGECVEAMVDVDEFHGVADAQAAAVGILRAGVHAEQSGLAGDRTRAREGKGGCVGVV